MFFDIWYLIFLSPALLLMMWAQWRLRSTYANAMQVPVNMSGVQAARQILDEAGLHDVGIEPVGGQLSDHYDPRSKVLRLSQDVYGGNSAASVGIAAHEAGHALQDAHQYGPLVIRSAAVPLANFGGQWGFWIIMAGLFLPALGIVGYSQPLIFVGVACFFLVAAFQIINLPVEFDASNRAKRLLLEKGIVDGHASDAVSSVLNAAAWTYVAGTLQSIMIALYYAMRFLGGSRND